MVLKKNQALDGGSDWKGKRRAGGTSNVQMLDNPLHDAEVVHHLHKGNEEDDSG
jgi:hypothetical protein